jgi:hypothetical protein
MSSVFFLTTSTGRKRGHLMYPFKRLRKIAIKENTKIEDPLDFLTTLNTHQKKSKTTVHL